MTTITQCAVKKKRLPKPKKSRSAALRKCPQKRAVCVKVFTTNPKKPNSAKRKVTRVLLRKFNKKITIAIPGKGHSLQKHSKVLVRGGNSADLPVVRCKAVRGKLDLKPLFGCKHKRSKYGIKKDGSKNSLK